MKGMQSAQGIIGKFTSNVFSMGGALASVAAGGFAVAMKSAIEFGDALGDVAANLGVNLEAYQALKFATEQLGGSQQALNAAMRTMRNVVGEAARGATGANKILNALGITSKQLAGLKTHEQFLKVVDALHGIQDESIQASIAQDIFGKGSKEMMSTVRSGTQEIMKFSDELARVGGILSQDSVDALGEANNALNKFSATWTAMKNQGAAQFAPEIVTAVDLITDAFVGLEKTLFRVWQGEMKVLEGLFRFGKMTANIASYVLPKGMEQNPAEFDSYIDSFRAAGIDYGKKADELGKGGNNPLRQNTPAGGGKQVEKNTATTNEKLDEQTAVLNRIAEQRGPQLAVAGVR